MASRTSMGWSHLLPETVPSDAGAVHWFTVSQVHKWVDSQSRRQSPGQQEGACGGSRARTGLARGPRTSRDADGAVVSDTVNAGDTANAGRASNAG
ncbi:hypothetical protein GCM10027073_54520 [Streptomyces chlorus]